MRIDQRTGILATVGLIAAAVAFSPGAWLLAFGERGLIDNLGFWMFSNLAIFSLLVGFPLLVVFGVMFPRKRWKRVLTTICLCLMYAVHLLIVAFFWLICAVGQMQTMD